MIEKMSLRDRLDCLVDFVGMILLCLLPSCLPHASSLPPTAPFRLQLPSPNSFFRICFSTLFAADLNDFLPLITSPISCSKLQHVSTYAFCRWDDIFTQTWNCSSPNILCESPKSPSTLSSKPSIVWNFYWS